MIIGCDIDGVLADFNTSFIQRVVDVTGRDLFPPCPFDIPTWNYPEFYGYTPDEVSAVWASIKSDCTFWEMLPPYADTARSLRYLEDRRFGHGDDIYYVTARPGFEAKTQTERWLLNQGVVHPTVIISSQKGMVCRALNVNAYIDDRWENAMDVVIMSDAKSYMLTRPWNRGNDPQNQAIIEVEKVADFVGR